VAFGRYPNKHPGTCDGCRAHIFAGAGFIIRDPSDTRWILACPSCTNPSPTQGPRSAAGAATDHLPPKQKLEDRGASKSGELNRLIKLMKLTTSATDGESLAAIRKANEWLSRQGLDWEQLLLAKVTIMADPFASIEAPPAASQPSAPPSYYHARPSPPPRPKADPFDFDFTNGTPDYSRPANPRAARARPAPTQAPRTFAADVQSSTPSRKPAPSASEL
jgi:hypothetical protein